MIQPVPFRCNPDILNLPYQFASVFNPVFGIAPRSPIQTPCLSATTRSRIVFRGASRNANTFLPRYRRSISTTRVHEARTTREPYPRPVTISPISAAYTRRSVSRTCNKQCRSCAQWRRNAKNRSVRNGSKHRPDLRAPARILLLKASTARINDGQIHHYKVKGPQWVPLPSSFLVARTKLSALYPTRFVASADLW